MTTYKFTNGTKEVKTYKEISNKNQGCYSENETLRTFKSNKLFDNEQYDTRFEEIKN